MIMEFRGKYPRIDPMAFIAENAMVIGEVEIGPGSNIWLYSILREDLYFIRIVKSLWSRACPLDIKFLIR